MVSTARRNISEKPKTYWERSCQGSRREEDCEIEAGLTRLELSLIDELDANVMDGRREVCTGF